MGEIAKMKGRTEYSILSWVAVAAVVLVLHSGCDNNLTNSSENLASELSVTDLKNIIWTLDKSGYEPFHLIFNEEQFFGYDGCNWFGARYEAHSDSIFPRDLVQTQRGCTVKTFSVAHFVNPFLLGVDRNELRILGRNVSLTFESDVTETIENSPLLRNWILTASTDPEFGEIQEQQLIPTLSFDENRGFKLAWYCVPENTFGCDETFGIFGIGARGKVFFYRTGWQNHAAGSEFMERILDSSSYTVEADTLKAAKLILFNKNSGKRFEFKAVSR